MSEFRTVLKPSEAPFDLKMGLPILSIGSCFAERISDWLRLFYFDVTDNPFGIVYNPLSMAEQLNILLGRQTFDPDWGLWHRGLYHSWLHHGSFSHTDAGVFHANIAAKIKEGQEALATAQALILTFGTAQVFEHLADARVVANCHKVPPQYFRPKRLQVTEIVEKMGETFSFLQEAHPTLPIILSVSPVRHLRDGLIGNNRSKAVLLLAAEALADAFPNVYYFPAYELVLDDLRDYRFYEKDYIHPNAQAFDYICNHFQHSFLSADTQKYFKSVGAYNQQKNHKLLFPDTPEALVFKEKMALNRLKLLKEYPFLDQNPRF